jgi:hypothetical protein
MADKPNGNHRKDNTLQDQPGPLVDAVLRRCKVCEWEGEVIEPADANPDCPWCHGPTERKATLATSTGVVASGDKNPHAAALGRLGGLKGGRARAEALTPSQRRRIASRAAKARWDKKKDSDEKDGK